MSGSGDVDIQALARNSLKAQPAQHCWATRLDGQSAEYVALVKEMKANGEPVVGAAVQRILQSAFGIKVDAGQVRNHLNSVCVCQKSQ